MLQHSQRQDGPTTPQWQCLQFPGCRPQHDRDRRPTHRDHVHRSVWIPGSHVHPDANLGSAGDTARAAQPWWTRGGSRRICRLTLSPILLGDEAKGEIKGGVVRRSCDQVGWETKHVGWGKYPLGKYPQSSVDVLDREVGYRLCIHTRSPGCHVSFTWLPKSHSHPGTWKCKRATRVNTPTLTPWPSQARSRSQMGGAIHEHVFVEVAKMWDVYCLEHRGNVVLFERLYRALLIGARPAPMRREFTAGEWK